MFKKISKIAILGIFFFSVFGFLCLNANVTKATTFNPNVTIPGSDFKHEEADPNNPDKEPGKALNRSTEPIAEYMRALYVWGVNIVGILAGVVLVIAGMMWLTAGGNNTQVESAKKWIGGALSGLVLALGSYLLLYQINPNLTEFQWWNIPGVDVGGEEDTDDNRKWYYNFVAHEGTESYQGPFDSEQICNEDINDVKDNYSKHGAEGKFGECEQLLYVPETSP